ncbi:MAG TPA: fused MFS/spermidine synthase [Gemmataceae bacterium]|nr:fused MFS/spermidine synthase [Gemmataceae bacterium]
MSAAVSRVVSPALMAGLGATVFLANAGLLVLQLLAGRFLAPFIGSSVETWTCVIGVFLTGIALGNHYGGKLADRSPSTRTLGRLLLLGAACSLSMILWWMIYRGTGFDRVLPLGPRIPILAVLFCLPPAFALSLITPLTIKLMLPDVTKAGRVAGLVFALSTLGCLLGNYVTGFWLMADYTLNTITVVVALGLCLLAVPMFVVDFRLTPAAIATADSTAPAAAVTREDDPLGFRRDIRRAFVVVFLASFCGMSLELVASRVLAPVLGVSLYSWTGIIGVMLAGTACGNYLGGVLADRGSNIAFRRFALLMATAIGFAGGPALVRSFRLDGFPEEGSPEWWAIRIVCAILGYGLAWVVVRTGTGSRGQMIRLAGLGAALGFAVAHPVSRSFGKLVGLGDLHARFHATNQSAGFDFGSLVVHLVGAAVGALIAVGIGYDKDRKDEPASRSSALAMCLFGASLFSGLVVLMNGVFQNKALRLEELLTGHEIVWNVFAWTFMLFFVPMLCLGTISPQVIRMSIPDTARAGRTAGTIYAWSTAGAIVGTFATGYLLIEWLGTARLLFLLAVILMGMTFVIGRLWTHTTLLFGGSIVFGIAVVGMFAIGYQSQKYDLETKYYSIRVESIRDEEDSRIEKYKTLSLDRLIHSYVRPDDPTWLGYPHEEVQGEIARYYRTRGPTEILVIGGGGYTFPRWVDYMLPDIGVDVVEIDPGVTEIAHRELGLPRRTAIRTHHMDGRQFVRERARKGHYQLVIQDAVNDLSVPYHLMTKEYNDAVKETLAPGGAYLLTLIEPIEEGELWRAAVHTMRETFKYVTLLDPHGFNLEGRFVFIVYGSDEPFDLAEVRATAAEAYARIGREHAPFTHQLSQERLEYHLSTKPALILTDQYAPVDNLMANVFRERSKKGY